MLATVCIDRKIWTKFNFPDPSPIVCNCLTILCELAFTCGNSATCHTWDRNTNMTEHSFFIARAWSRNRFKLRKKKLLPNPSLNYFTQTLCIFLNIYTYIKYLNLYKYLYSMLYRYITDCNFSHNADWVKITIWKYIIHPKTRINWAAEGMSMHLGIASCRFSKNNLELMWVVLL